MPATVSATSAKRVLPAPPATPQLLHRLMPAGNRQHLRPQLERTPPPVVTPRAARAPTRRVDSQR